MNPEEKRRYQQALQFAYNAEKEIVKLQARIEELEAATTVLAVVADAAMDLLEGQPKRDTSQVN